MNKNKLIHNIGSKLIDDIGGRKKDWVHMVLVGRIDQDATQMSGFVYYKNGEHEPVSPRDPSILELLTELRNAMGTADNKEPWSACLVRVDRATGEINVEFEYGNTDRWVISVKNSNQRAKELSPVRG